jgi:nanoRNase/pAp phosphatase (c-di-AMP/oligoRNAs hydrolase)
VSPKAQEFFDKLARHSGERMLLLLQDYPDPDALSCAVAHSFLAQAHDVECFILYGGEVSHHENRALTKLLEIPALTYEEGLDFRAYQAYCFLDGQGSTVSFRKKIPEELALFSVVDHHALQGELVAEFLDIRQGVGATASIYAEYLEQSGLTLDRDKDEHRRVATALMLGIRSDTNRMVQAEPFDYRMAAFISPYVDRDILRRVESQTRSRQTLDVIRKALDNMILHGAFVIAGVGNLRSAHKDAIPQAADFLLNVEGIESSFVYANVEGTIQGSLRTKSDQIDPDSFLKQVFGKDEGGRFYGGGRSQMGGFQIPLGYISRHAEQEDLWELIKLSVETDVLRVLDPLVRER